MAARLERGLISFERMPVDVLDVVAEAVRHAGGDEVTADVPAGLAVMATPDHLSSTLEWRRRFGSGPRCTAGTSRSRCATTTAASRRTRWGGPRRFRRDDTTVLTRPGSGLGLYVTRRLVDGMGGGLEVWSERGAGCRASIRLPLHVATGPATGQPVRQPIDEAAPAHPG